MEANENAILEIMDADVDVIWELPAGNTTPIKRKKEEEAREVSMRGDDETGKGNENGSAARCGSGNAKGGEIDDNTAEPVVVEIKHAKRCELKAIKNTAKNTARDAAKDAAKDNYVKHQRSVERRPGGQEEEGAWF